HCGALGARRRRFVGVGGEAVQ
ncbi:hypothetical protein CSUI_008801, partial [Cystoisospora suis]